MKKYVHISAVKPREFVLGGVSTFQKYLQRAIPEMELIAWSDFPDRKSYGVETPDFQKAEILNAWLLKQGIVGEGTTAIVDGYWGLGLPGKVDRVASVVHGSYFGRFLNAQVNPWGEFVGIDQIEAQFEMWKDVHVEPVCVSRECRIELKKAGISPATTIHHGVDLDVYYPFAEKPGHILMHAVTSARKGHDILSMVMEIDSTIHIEFMDEHSGKAPLKAARLNEARALVAPSRHEGNAYALIEALACGVPIIAYKTGLVPEMDSRCGLMTDDISPQNFIRLIRQFHSDNHNPREWAEEHCDYRKFAGSWRQYLGYA